MLTITTAIMNGLFMAVSGSPSPAARLLTSNPSEFPLLLRKEALDGYLYCEFC